MVSERQPAQRHKLRPLDRRHALNYRAEAGGDFGRFSDLTTIINQVVEKHHFYQAAEVYPGYSVYKPNTCAERATS